ncbi:ATP-binding protein [Kitasatospora sp. NPDC088391]|uniref:ATP-binding protein n=1 Tax=Kitasatospora sp. NPDC088391 TaxID=3364074 RepID=UPI003822264A
MLREQRRRAGLTQEELAERAGVSAHAISMLEAGRRRPRLSSVTRLAAALGLDEAARTRLMSAAEGAAEGAADTPPAAGTAAAATATATAGTAAATAAEPPNGAAGASRCQLPADTRLFTGRAKELDRLLALAREAPAGSDAGMVVISAIDGMGGVGKSALAVHAAHRLRGSFPDGQLFIDLHGHTPGLAALAAEDALDWFLRSLGVPPQLIPQDLGERAAFYRDRLAGTRTLIVLDNAVSTAQVRPLLPGTPGSLVIVTSRKRLTGLDDAHTLALDTLAPAEAAALLHRVAGPGRVPEDHPAIAELAALCGHVPLAVRISAARLRHRRALRIEDLVDELRDEHDRLDRLRDEGRNLTAVFDTSYAALPEAEQHLFRRLGLVPGPDFDAFAAANLTGTDHRTADRLLESLLDHNLLTQHVPGRYRFHDLVGLYARTLDRADRLEEAEHTEEAERAAALERLLDYYRHTADDADRHLAHHSRPGAPRPAPAPAVAPVLPDRAKALAWMRSERNNLLAAVAGARPRHLIDLSGALAAFLQQEGPWHQAAALHGTAADTARAHGDRPGEAGALEDLGRVRHALGEFRTAADLHERSLALYQDLGDRFGEAGALEDLGRVRYVLGEFRTASELHERALVVHQDLGDRLGEAGSRWSIGRVRHATGDYPEAVALLERALETYRGLGNHHGEANTLWDLSRVRQATGDYSAAGSLQEQALTIMRQLGNRHGEANALWNLGRVRLTTGDATAAAAALERALEIYLDLGKRDGEAYALKDLGRVRLATGDTAAAADLLDRSLEIFRKVGQRYGAANATHDLGRVRHATGDTAAAADLFAQALAFFREVGDRQGEAEVLTSTGALTADTTGADEAAALYRRALDLARRAHSPLDEARALEGTARCAARTGDHATALTALRRAVALYRRLGAAEAPAAATRLRALEDADRG